MSQKQAAIKLDGHPLPSPQEETSYTVAKLCKEGGLLLSLYRHPQHQQYFSKRPHPHTMANVSPVSPVLWLTYFPDLPPTLSQQAQTLLANVLFGPTFVSEVLDQLNPLNNGSEAPVSKITPHVTKIQYTINLLHLKPCI